MQVINCKQIRQEMLTEAKLELTKIFALTGKVLKLAVIQVGDDPASSTYIKNKIKTCSECGIECEHIKLPGSINIGDLRKIVVATCEDKNVTGCMIQLPLPEHLKKYEQSLLDLIPWDKDVDGLCTDNVGRLWADKPCIVPATAQGIMRLLPENLSYQKICIAGRSNLVGKPLIKLLMDRNATVEVLHSKTRESDMEYSLEYCDIFISAIGKPKHFKLGIFLDSSDDSWFGANRPCCNTIIDVGINRDKEGKLCGDIDIDTFKHTTCSITPVPGGIGLITVSQLILNIIKAYQLQNGDLHV